MRLGTRTSAVAAAAAGGLCLFPASGVSFDAPRAVDMSREAGILESSLTWSANVHDFDQDGWDDVMVVRHNQASSRLYRNDQGHFTEVNEGDFPAAPYSGKDRHDCAWGDVDQDGLPDMYCTMGASHGTAVKANELWMQQPDGSFVDRAARYDVVDKYGRGRRTTFIDVNHDDFPDLYVGNGFPRNDDHVSRNRLFINVGGERFRDGHGYGLSRQVGGKSVQAADFDGDGWKDLLVCGKERLYLYRNLRGQDFKDVSRRTKIGRGCEAAALADADRDGRMDLVTVAADRVRVELQGRAAFQRPAFRRELSGGGSLAVGDVNSDSYPDLYVLRRGREDSDRPDLMLLNRHSGRDFSKIRIPQTSKGIGDSVAAMDYDNNGQMDFVVLNGHARAPGPVRLIAFK